ncbi:MAG: oligosaccharide flippase family protein [Muribaculaceae bacterium]|nr:oligosaccharide flippase family protein [Muribaculaceae bacterium]
MSRGGETNISRTIVKAMGVFGSIQVFNILCSVVRTKLVALWIGPLGMGLFAIFNSAIDMIVNIANFGMRTSATRSISMASDNPDKLNRISVAARRWAMWLGALGAIAMIIASPWLSEMSFGDRSHVWGYVILAIAVFANSLTLGEQAVMQGTSMLKKLAQASFYGALVGLILSIPLYYFLGEQSIVPSILCYSLSVLIFSYFIRKKGLGLQGCTLTIKDTLAIGKDFLKLGIFITLTDVVSQTSNYIFISYLNNVANTETVGYYQAGYTLIARYTGLILSALCVEYFPRLSKVAHSNMKLNIFVSQEINIALMVLTPVIVAFILFARLIITILYTDEFFIIQNFITIGIVGMVFRVFSWCMSFVVLAKGRGKMFFIIEVMDIFVFLGAYITAYHFYGLDGFGGAFILWYFISTLIVMFCYYHFFNLRLNAACFKWGLWALSTSIVTLVAMQNGLVLVAVAMLVFTAVYSAVKFRALMSRHK